MTIREFYDAIGADYEDMIVRIPLEDMIGEFVEMYVSSGVQESMQEAYAGKNYRGVFETSHNLKGMCANLSLTVIRDLASDICEATRNGEPAEDISGKMQEAQAAHEKLVELFKQVEK